MTIVEHEKNRYDVLLHRSEVLDQRAATLLSALALVGTALGAFFAFTLNSANLSAFKQLAARNQIWMPLIVALSCYVLSMILLASSLGFGISLYEPMSEQDGDDTVVGKIRAASSEMAKWNNCKWWCFIGGLTTLSIAACATAATAAATFYYTQRLP